MKDQQNFLQRYVQYSKKITLFGMVQWCVLALLSLGIVIFSMTSLGALDEYGMGIVKTVVVWAATVAFVSVGSYEANSAIEKAVKARVQSLTEKELDINADGEKPDGGNG